MAEPVFWIVEANIKQGALDGLRSLIEEMVTNTKAHEPGTLSYEWFVDPGMTRCRIVERYRDSEAAMVHLRTFDRAYAERLGRLVQIERVTLFGKADTAVLEALGDQGTLFLLPLNGFTR